MRVLLLALATVSSQVMGLAQMGSPGGGETQVIALHPTDPGTLYAGAAKGLCKTTSGGKDNWPSSGLEALSPRAIVLDRSKPQVLYVGTYEMGVYKSTDGARSWSRTSSGITNGRIRGLVIDPENGQIVYAGTDGGGVFKTVDGGKNWREANRGLVDKTLRSLVGDPGNAEILYAGTWHGVYKSTDGGEIWSANRNGLYDIDVRAIAIDPSKSQRALRRDQLCRRLQIHGRGTELEFGERVPYSAHPGIGGGPHRIESRLRGDDEGRFSKHRRGFPLPAGRTAMVQQDMDAGL